MITKKTGFFLIPAFFLAALMFSGCPMANDGGGGDTLVNNLDLTALVPAPATGERPAADISAEQYTGTIGWWDAAGNLAGDAFAPQTAYTATVALTVKTGYTFSGLGTDSFTHSGADAISAVFGEDGTTAVITITFPAAPVSSAEAKAAFLAFVATVNAGSPATDFDLEADIDLGDVPGFAPIGSSSNIYTGTFDGNGHHILNLNISTSTGFTGLFAANAGTIKNLEVSGSVTSTTTGDYVGGIAGYNSQTGTIEAVTAHITVTASSAYNVGGIAGFNGHDTINAGSPYYGDSYAEGGTITKCLNTGAVTGKQKTGGIAGQNAGTISLCANTGNITGTLTGSGGGTAGIAGRNGNNNTAVEKGKIINCYNTGVVDGSGGRYIAGIAGFRNDLSIVENCYNITEPQNAYNDRASIVARQDHKSTNNDGYAGYCANNYSLTGFTAQPNGTTDEFYIGIEKTETELKNPEFLTAIGGAFAADVNNINNGYPVLAWQNE
jgi:hypothetical protein